MNDEDRLRYELAPTPELRRVRERAEASGLEAVERTMRISRDPKSAMQLIYRRAGTPDRHVFVFEDEAKLVLDHDFEELRFIEGLRAFYSTKDSYIVATVQAFPLRVRLRDLPGSVELPPDAEDEAKVDAALDNRPIHWKLDLASRDARLTVSLGSAQGIDRVFLSHLSRDTEVSVLRIEGVNFADAAGAKRTLERLVQAISFEMDVLYGFTLRMPDTERAISVASRNLGDRVLALPENTYEVDALGFYLYGRQAENLPLLEFLAYYQTIEYFFPSFTKEDEIKRLRTAVKHPRFDPNKDRDIEKLLSLSSSGGRPLNEEEQLKAAVRGSVSAEELREFLEEEADRWSHMTGKAKFTKAKQIAPENKQVDIRDQYAARVYDIRCRIVHTKSDGAGRESMLLPSSKDAKSLGHDIDALRFLAQQVLVARAVRS